MVESQTESVQTHAAARIILAAVFSITHHRVTDVGHVDTNLVLTPGEQVEEQQRTALGLFDKFPLG